MPFDALQVTAGTLLLLFGVRWMRKAILRHARAPGSAFRHVAGVVASAFGIFWFGEGVGLAWPYGDATIPALAVLLLAASAAGVRLARRGGADNENLAIWIALILAAVAFVASSPWCKAPCVGPVFVAAVVAALLASVWRRAR